MAWEGVVSHADIYIYTSELFCHGAVDEIQYRK